MAIENSHSMLLGGICQAAAGEVSLGTITLPADGPWLVHGVFGQVVRPTATAGEAVGGYFRIEAASGDLEPNPQPAKFPCWESGSFLGATAGVSYCRLHRYDVAWTAPGRSTLNVYFNNVSGTSVAPKAVVGILFGRTLPVLRPIVWVDHIRGTQSGVTETALSNITLSERATSIVGVGGAIVQDGVLTTAEELIGYFRLISNDIDIAPLQLPFGTVYGAGLGGTIDGGTPGVTGFIPVDVPVVGGAVLTPLVTLLTAVTNPADVDIHIAYM
jgi:hypothetical protein